MDTPITPTPPVKKWSFSAIRDFEACGYRTFLSRVERAPRPNYDELPDHPLTRGNRLHAEAEHAVRGEGPITTGLRRFEDLIKDLQKEYLEGRVMVEQKWGVTRDWAPADWDDEDCWGMVIGDVVHRTAPNTMRVIDWKSGKSMGKEIAHQQQMQLYAIAALMRFPEIELLETTLAYLDEGKTRSKTYTRASITPLLPRWHQRASNLTNALVFRPKPNRGNCGYCDFSRNREGTGACPYAVDTE